MLARDEKGCQVKADHDVTVSCLYGWKYFAQRCCGEGTARR